MANIFDITNERNNDVNQNSFDWSHVINLTGRLGIAYPFFSDVVPAKTSFRVTPKLGLQFMPMVFPIQTPMKARVSFFRMPLRALWKDYKDYVGNFKQGLVEPYLDLATSFEDFIGTGKLGDYLGIPTVLSGRYGAYADVTLPASISSSGYSQAFRSCFFVTDDDSKLQAGASYFVYGSGQPSGVTSFSAIYFAAPLDFSGANLAAYDGNISKVEMPAITLDFAGLAAPNRFAVKVYLASFDSTGKVVGVHATQNLGVLELGVATDEQNHYRITVTPDFPLDEHLLFGDESTTLRLVIALDPSLGEETNVWSPIAAYYSSYSGTLPYSEGLLRIGQEPNADGYKELTRDTSPYFDSTSDSKDRQIKLKAYTARTYEAINNAFFRDNRNNPYYLNGQLEYNVWIPTNEGGADMNTYKLHRVNWEKDFLTTAVPSPQQGKSPLVGLTTYTDTETVDGISKTALRMALVDEDGKRYGVRFSTADGEIQSVEYAEISDRQVVPLSYRALIDSASTGISIPDLRLVNAYQKFLELNMRKGYSYKEIVEGRFDCQVRYDDLDMPEFLGGFTRNINMNRVVQSVEKDATEAYPKGSYANALGSLAGDAFLSAEGQPISCFCDEESVIMGIISIVPQPAYSQLLPKHYLYNDLLDHFQPEFDNLGFQPITYREVCPVQAFNAGDDLDGVFGYQRPWYDLVQRTDQVHGLFRTQLRNFLMNRVFEEKPELTKSFLLVDDEQLNDVFAVTQSTDKWLGQIYMDCQVKLPISRVSIPRLD